MTPSQEQSFISAKSERRVPATMSMFNSVLDFRLTLKVRPIPIHMPYWKYFLSLS